jgi:CheY-like chemotaxis protein
VSNAIKFTPKEGTVHVSLSRKGTDVELVVEDSGEGISAQFLPYVFDRFRQAEAGTTRRHGGLGLGLALVRHLVEAHGGSAVAESAGAGLGSRFTIILPVQAVFPERPRVNRTSLTPSDAPATHTALAGVTALVVDDDEDARDLVSTVLLATGAQVKTAANAGHALDLLDAGSFGVVVSDIGMPGMNGYELIRQHRLRASTSARTPAIALTAYAREEDRRLALEAGFDAHVAKPVDPDELVRLVVSLALVSRSSV